MKTKSYLPFACRLLAVVLALATGIAAHAQMPVPQDNWQSYGLQFSSPTPGTRLSSIAVGKGGVYVGEIQGGPSWWATSILQFTEGGIFIQRFTTAFTNIRGIACDSAGNVYVLDSGASSVTKLDQNGTFISQWGSSGTNNGQFSLSGGYGTSMIAVDKNNQIYVCDPGNTRVQVFDSNGNFLREWGQAGSLPSQFANGQPSAIAVALDGRVITGNASVNIISDANGNFITTLQGATAWPYVTQIGNSMQFSPDGLLTFLWGSYVLSFDASLLWPLLDFFAGGANYAYSTRGDCYVVIDDIVKVYQREYASVQNSLSPPAIPLPIVLDAAQRPGTSWMDIDYQVTDADNPTGGVTTGVLAFVNYGSSLNETVVMSTFMENSGTNVGLNQPTGVPLHLTWNMAADWSVDYSQVQIEALAKDSRNLLGFQWITVPASGGIPAIQVSAKSISDSALLDIWFYLLATHQPGISLAGGTITGTAGAYNGVVLAGTNANGNQDGVSTTAAGRQYLYGLLNVRAIAPSEITQTQGGNYGFTSVDANSVVKLP